MTTTVDLRDLVGTGRSLDGTLQAAGQALDGLIAGELAALLAVLPADLSPEQLAALAAHRAALAEWRTLALDELRDWLLSLRPC